MNKTEKAEGKKLRNMVAMYNMVPNLFWTVIHLTPISIYCYNQMDIIVFCYFLFGSILLFILPNSFFDNIQLSKTTSFYKSVGVRFINRFAQNGEIINNFIRKKAPRYRVLSNKKSSVSNLIKTTYLFEKFHFAMFMFFISTTIYAGIKNQFLWVFVLIVTNIFYNVYPNLLQQYIRLKLRSLNTCPRCGWEGIGSETHVAGFYGIGKFKEVICPKCNEYPGNLSRENFTGERGNKPDSPVGPY